MLYSLPSITTVFIVKFKQLLFLHTKYKNKYELSSNKWGFYFNCIKKISFSAYTILEDTAKCKFRFRYKILTEDVLKCVIGSEMA